MNDANALKEQGNEALNAGNISRAIECYSEAIQLTNNVSELAIFYSNRAQAFMDQRSFFNALKDIAESLNYNPDFKKTILRRAVVYFELGNHIEAARDFRFILRHHPDNPTAQIYMKRMFPPAKLNNRFLETYTIHGLRFAFKNPTRTMPHNCITTEHAIKTSLVRHLFLSARFSPILGRLLHGIEMFDESPNQTIGIRLPVYFKNKWEHVAMMTDKFAVYVSDQLLYLILNMTQPTSTYLFLGTTTGIFRYGQFYNFDFISLSPSFLFYTNHINKEAIPLVEAGGRLFTILPYFSEMSRISDISFPNLNSLIIIGNKTPDLEFLKLWKLYKWKIRNVYFENCVPNMASFLRFKRIVSEHVTVLQIPLIDRTIEEARYDQLSIVKQNLRTFKRLFPSLNEVIGFIRLNYWHEAYPIVCGDYMVHHIVQIIDSINSTVKPNWLLRLKVLIKFVSMFNECPKEDIQFEELEKIVQYCKQHSKQLKSIELHKEKEFPTFDWSNLHIPQRVIKASTNYADFEFLFETCNF